jgi:hypothetical protein
MKQHDISPQDAADSEERDWRAVEDDVLARVRSVSHSITERVRKLIDETNSSPSLGADPTDETPPVQ